MKFLVRDNWEVKIPELEANLSSIMGVPWKICVDAGYIYSFAEDRHARETTGKMLTEYDSLFPPPCYWPCEHRTDPLLPPQDTPQMPTKASALTSAHSAPTAEAN